MNQKFEVKGMTCSACVTHIEKDVKKIKGIKKVNVSLINHSMVVEYDESLLDSSHIIHQVQKGGYDAETSDSVTVSSSKDLIDTEKKALKQRLFGSIIFFIPLLYLSMGEMLRLPQFSFLMGMENALNMAFMQFLLTLPIVYWNRAYFKVGIKRLWLRSPNMDSLVAIGSLAALIYGIIAIFMIGTGLGRHDMVLVDHYRMNLYFEAAGSILTLVTVGKTLEAISKDKTTTAIKKLIQLVPKTAWVEVNGITIERPIESLTIGDVIQIRPGTRIPVDGVIIEGHSSFDESVITGESMPLEKTVGDSLISGTINQTGFIRFKATKVGNDTTISQIVRLVEEAASSKAPISKLADQISGIFVPIVIGIALIAFTVWLLLDYDLSFALSIGITVLVISCPCALGLATPMAMMVASGKGAENGILIKSAESLERLHQVTHVILDKTGTITEGKPKLTEYVSFTHQSKDVLLRIAYALEQASEHPLAKAIQAEAISRQLPLDEVKEFKAVVGQGIQGIIDGNFYAMGNQAFMTSFKKDITAIPVSVSSLFEGGKTVLFLADCQQILGVFSVSDTIKETSLKAIETLKHQGIRVSMLTGDHETTAKEIQKTIQVDEIYYEVTPAQKEAIVKQKQAEGEIVAMVGDGINDAVALTRADVGIAIGAGSDIAIESADIVLIKNDLQDVTHTIALSKKTLQTIKISLFWAFVYNLIGIPIAAGVFYFLIPGLTLNPMIGSLAMSLSSISVSLNALWLRRFKINTQKRRIAS